MAKVLDNKKSEILIPNPNNPDSPKHIDYAYLAMQLCNDTPEKGFTPSMMKERLDLLDKLEKAGAKITLENSEAEFLAKTSETFAWGVLDRFVYAFTQDVKNMPEAK